MHAFFLFAVTGVFAVDVLVGPDETSEVVAEPCTPAAHGRKEAHQDGCFLGTEMHQDSFASRIAMQTAAKPL